MTTTPQAEGKAAITGAELETAGDGGAGCRATGKTVLTVYNARAEVFKAPLSEVVRLEAENRALRTALELVMKEHNDTMREASEIGHSDGLYLRPALYLLCRSALSQTTIAEDQR